jgi:uncharacterized alkaline shock family protein YloU
MTRDYRSPGKTTLTPDVLLTIARMTAIEVEGVSHMAPVKGGVNNLFTRGQEGVQIVVEDGNVLVDLFLVLEKDVNIREVSRTVQHSVARALSEMTGLEVGHVNIHIEDIAYKAEA